MPDVDEVARRLEDGESAKAIAADLGVTPRTIRNWLHAARVPLASDRKRQRRLAPLNDPAWLRVQFVDERRNASTIARGLGVPTAEVRRALNRSHVKRPPLHPELTAAALRRAFRTGATVSSIARDAGVQRATVRTAMRRHGVVNPGANRGRRPVELDDADWLRVRHVEQGATVSAIADELGADRGTVRRALRRHGIPVQPYMRPRADIVPSWLQQRFEVDLAPTETIAAEAGVSVSTVRRAAQRLGYTRSLVRDSARSRIDPAWLAERYQVDGRTLVQIAAEVGVSSTTVLRVMVAHGIPRRPRPTAIRSTR